MNQAIGAVALSFAVVLAGGTGASAQSVAQAPAVAAAPAAETPEGRIAAAKDLLVAMQAKEMFKTQFEASLPKQMANIQKEYPDMSEGTRKIIESAFREETERSLDSLMGDIAGLYAKRFSVDEMRTIAAFHRTKAGSKLRNESEQLQRELTGVANTWSLEVVRKISKRLQEQLREQKRNGAKFSS